MPHKTTFIHSVSQSDSHGDLYEATKPDSITDTDDTYRAIYLKNYNALYLALLWASNLKPKGLFEYLVDTALNSLGHSV